MQALVPTELRANVVMLGGGHDAPVRRWPGGERAPIWTCDRCRVKALHYRTELHVPGCRLRIAVVLVGTNGIEPLASALSGPRSNQLSYVPMCEMLEQLLEHMVG